MQKPTQLLLEKKFGQATFRHILKLHHLKKTGLEHYRLLGIIFNRSTAIGVLHHSSTQDPPNTDKEYELENEYLNTRVYVDLDADSPDDADMIERTTHSEKRKVQIQDKRHKKERRTFQMGDALQA